MYLYINAILWQNIYFISVDVSNDASRNLQTEDDKDRDEVLKQSDTNQHYIYRDVPPNK